MSLERTSPSPSEGHRHRAQYALLSQAVSGWRGGLLLIPPSSGAPQVADANEGAHHSHAAPVGHEKAALSLKEHTAHELPQEFAAARKPEPGMLPEGPAASPVVEGN